MDTRTLKETVAASLTAVMDACLASRKYRPSDVYAVEAEADLGMLVEPVNGAPYVFQLPNTVHVFDYKAGSGTDKLRQRIEAGIFFRGLVAARDTQKARAEAEAAMVAATSSGAASAERRRAKLAA